MSYIAKNGRLYTSGASEALTLLDDKFSVNKSYSKGDSCIYNDCLWKFTSDKPAGEWNPSVVEQCRIMDFVDGINNDLTQTNGKIEEIQSHSAVVGSMTIFAGSVVPDGYLLCDGQAVSRSKYSKLFEVIGTTWGAGDGSTTFNVPDMREVAPVGIGQSNRTEGTHDVFTLGEFKDDQLQTHTHSIRYWATTGDANINGAAGGGLSSKSGTGNNNGRTGTVTRGKRIGVNYIIKY